MNPKIDSFLEAADTWQDEMSRLRKILLGCGLSEDLKWGKPCYRVGADGGNVAILQPFKANVALMFFKGALMKDPKGILESPGASSQAAKRVAFTSLDQISKFEPVLISYIEEAIRLEKSGSKVAFKKQPEPVPPELTAAFKADPKLKAAFAALTPGRQRSYLLHFNGAKQSATRVNRIEKCVASILAGKGFNER